MDKAQENSLPAAVVRRASTDDFEGVHELLKQFNNRALSSEDWRRLFDNGWGEPGDPRGYVLESRGRIVGFFGMLFSSRRLQGAERCICNLTSWIVEPKFRRQSLELLYRILDHKDATITCLTASEVAGKVYLAKGFKVLDEGTAIVPVATLWCCKAANERNKGGIQLKTGDITELLSEDERKLYHDHEPYGCEHLVVQDGSKRCYLIAMKVKLQWMTLGYLHYIGNHELLRDNFSRASGMIASSLKAQALMIDLRMVRDLPIKRYYLYPRVKYYRPVGGLCPDIDNLYSEMILLRHGFFEDVPHVIRAMFLRNKPAYLRIEKELTAIRHAGWRVLRRLSGPFRGKKQSGQS